MERHDYDVKQREDKLIYVSSEEAFCMNFHLNIKFDCNGRLNYARPEILDLMKEAGCVYINYGIEAYDNQFAGMDNAIFTFAGHSTPSGVGGSVGWS